MQDRRDAKPPEPKQEDDIHGPVYTTDEVRQGEIILKKRWQRIVFIGGLAAVVILIAVVSVVFGARGV